METIEPGTSEFCAPLAALVAASAVPPAAMARVLGDSLNELLGR